MTSHQSSDAHELARLRAHVRRLEKILQEHGLSTVVHCDDSHDRLISFNEDITRRSSPQIDAKLLRDIIDLHEQERTLVAYDIHDGFVQEVVGAKMLLESMLANNGQTADEKTSHLIEQIRCALTRAIDDARRLVSELRPLTINEGDIVTAIRCLIAEKRYSESMKITFTPEGRFNYNAPLLCGNLFRIVQESLNNVARHSKAATVVIDLTSTETEITIAVADDGIGFDPEKIAQNHHGIRGMRERARIFGGELTVSSGLGRGTKIIAHIPVINSLNAARDET